MRTNLQIVMIEAAKQIIDISYRYKISPELFRFSANRQLQEEVDAIVPISKMRTLVEERTGANEANKFFKLNPYVADIPEKYAKDVGGVKLLVMGTVDVGGSGCVCPEHVMLKAILSSLTYRKDDVVILDMEAGLEHLGRGTAANMDQFIVVVEPGARSIQTYANVKRLAADLGVRQVRVVANKVRDQRDEDFVRSAVPEADFLGCIQPGNHGRRPAGEISLRFLPCGNRGNQENKSHY